LTSVTSDVPQAFYGCHSLTNVYFNGNAPSTADYLFNSVTGVSKATVYYLPGAKGFGKTFGNRPTAIWQK